MLAALMRRPQRHLVAILAAASTAAVLIGFSLRGDVRKKNQPNPSAVERTVADDVSHLNATEIRDSWDIPSDEANAQTALRELLKKAAASGLRVSVAGARHSMGGQTIAPGGIRVNMLPLKSMELDEDKNLLHVDAGARWADVIPYLDRRGRAVEVMQSDNSFTVGGSLSVNCHGWQYGRPPIASTVESFHLMKADGTVVRCSRTENQELFSAALGGYGLFGIILDADLHVVRNERLRLQQIVVPLDSAMASFERTLREHGMPRMVYARLNITRRRMFEDVLINMFYPEQGAIPKLRDPKLVSLRRAIFRGSAGSDYGKQVRWVAETKVAPYLSGTVFSRNQLMNESADWYLDHSNVTTDILHEYFVPKQGAVQFLRKAKITIRSHHADLLNVTVREVETDTDTFLRYADQPMIAFVMFFSQHRTAAAEGDMQQMTRELIDAAVREGGRYYLPYRLHASGEQFRAAYPNADDFFKLKTEYDPNGIFQNEWYLKYRKP
ncbi:MAG TPA: FAD-binding oxidoreductase [Terriglobales bacterium]|nr:FAD-binding oxidoreductase [Terriglobales bacterium]